MNRSIIIAALAFAQITVGLRRQIVDDYFAVTSVELPFVEDHLGVGEFQIDEHQSPNLVLLKAENQISLDIPLIPDPSGIRQGDELETFQLAVGDVLAKSAKILSQYGRHFNFIYLKSLFHDPRGPATVYIKGSDRLAAAVVDLFADSFPDQCPAIFLNLLDSMIGRLLNPHDFATKNLAKFVVLNNFYDKMNWNFDSDLLDALSLDFVKSFGVGFLEPSIFRLVFLASLRADDLLEFWLQMYTSIALEVRNIVFEAHESELLSYKQVSDMLPTRKETVNGEIRNPAGDELPPQACGVSAQSFLTESHIDDWCLVE